MKPSLINQERKDGKERIIVSVNLHEIDIQISDDGIIVQICKGDLVECDCSIDF